MLDLNSIRSQHITTLWHKLRMKKRIKRQFYIEKIKFEVIRYTIFNKILNLIS